MFKRNPKAGDVYCNKNEETGRYYAYQLIRYKKRDAIFLSLDYFKTKKPTKEDLQEIQPLKRQSRFYTPDTLDYCCSMHYKLPERDLFVANIPLLVPDKGCNITSYWPNGRVNIRELKWMDIPEEHRIKFKNSISDTTTVIIAGREYDKNLTELDDKILSSFDDFSQFENFPLIHRIKATYYYPQLISFLESRWTANKLTWENHGQRILDLSRTHLYDIELTADNLQILKLPKEIERIAFIDSPLPEMELSIPNENTNVKVSINHTDNIIPNMKYPGLKSLTLFNTGNIDISVIPLYYPNLEYLIIEGKPCTVKNISSLGNLKKLKALIIKDTFGYEADEFPAPESFENIRYLKMSGLPAKAGKRIQKLYKKNVETLQIYGLIEGEWYLENQYNPFYYWYENYSTDIANAAVYIYITAIKDALNAAKHFNDNNEGYKNKIERLSRVYAESFNKPVIDEDMRQEIYDAFELIIDRSLLIAEKENHKIDIAHYINIINDRI